MYHHKTFHEWEQAKSFAGAPAAKDGSLSEKWHHRDDLPGRKQRIPPLASGHVELEQV